MSLHDSSLFIQLVESSNTYNKTQTTNKSFSSSDKFMICKPEKSGHKVQAQSYLIANPHS